MRLIAVLSAGAIAVAAPVAHAQLHGKPTRGSGVKPEILYHNYCSVCHGDRGNGDSRAKQSLNPPPKNFNDAQNPARGYMIQVIANGKPGTAMAGWGTELSPGEVEGLADYIRGTFMRVSLDPKVRRGRELYEKHCSNCHGDRGEGRANPSIGMNQAPASLASPQARDKWTTAGLVEIIQNGRAGSFMISYRSQITPQDIRNVVDYIETAIMVPPTAGISGTHARASGQESGRTQGGSVDRTLPFPGNQKGNMANGRRLFAQNCVPCHGSKGDGQGPRAYFINPRPASFVSNQKRNSLNRPALFGAISAGSLGTEMPAWSKVLSDQEIADVGEFVFQTFILPNPPQAAKSAK